MTASGTPRGSYAVGHDRRPPARSRDEAPNRTALPRPFEPLERSDLELQRIVDAIPTQVWCLRPDGTVVYLNQRWHHYTGITPEEASRSAAHASDVAHLIVHPDDAPIAIAKWSQILPEGKPGEFEIRLRRHDGEYRWFIVRVEPMRNERGEVVQWYGTNTDIEDLKRAEGKLREEEHELRAMVDAIPESLRVLGTDGSVLFVNRAFLEFTGVTLSDALASGARSRLFHPEDVERLEEVRQRALSGDEPFENEQRLRRRDGQYRWFLFRFNPVRDPEGRVLRWYAIGTDIHERKQAEERIRNENLALREEIDRTSMFEEIVGSSRGLRQVLAQLSKVAGTDSTVLVVGETGTGKELIARAIHKRSRRAVGPFIRVNCAAIAPSLVTSELFGHEKGAFTGAVQRRLGRFEAANGGTILLDEIGDLPMETQVALLRVLQEREFERIGSTRPISVDVRVVAATNRDLEAAVAAGTFRQELFYRLNVFPIRIPPLRERSDDIPLLVHYLIERYANQAGKKIRDISKRTLDVLMAYAWPGNVRELQNVIERAVILCEGETFVIDESWLRHEARGTPAPEPTASLTRTLAEHEREMIEAALAASRGRISGPTGAASKLGIPRQTLESKIRILKIDKHHFRLV
jgi:formate hydrogenlyase transcriptional activator